MKRIPWYGEMLAILSELASIFVFAGVLFCGPFAAAALAFDNDIDVEAVLWLTGILLTAGLTFAGVRSEGCGGLVQATRRVAIVANLALAVHTISIWVRETWSAEVALPLGVCCTICTINIFSLAISLRGWSLSAHSCEACGYDLTGNETGVCPECGHEVTCSGPDRRRDVLDSPR